MNFLYGLMLFSTQCWAIDERARDSIRTTFQILNQLSPESPQKSDVQSFDGPSVSRFLEDQYFFKREDQSWMFALVVPENEAGVFLVHHMIAEAHRSHEIFGFQRASSLLQHSLWMFFTMNVPPDVKAAAFMPPNLTILLRLSTPLHLRPEEFFQRLSEDGLFIVHDYRQEWVTEIGDVLVVTWADLPPEFEEIVQLAVESVEEDDTPVSKIVSNLKAYFNIGREDENIFAAIRVT
ncbi:hypothetical protein JCM33374_g1989 [Metschnikowia sp. JCM 33374]|nr:hypothetical protein JCM33374_g1989 [Metschnikowia sp. JCM 33374]